MPGRLGKRRGSVHGQHNENVTPHLTLAPIEVAVGGDDPARSSLSKNYSIFSIGTDAPETPTLRGGAAVDHTSLSRSSGVTALLRPTSEVPAAVAAGLLLQPLSLSSNASPRLTHSSLTHSDWASYVEFTGVPEAGGLRDVNEGAAQQNASSLPVLTTISFPAARNASRSVGGGSASPPAVSAAAAAATPIPTGDAPPAGASTTTMHGMSATSPNSCSPSRSMTLLERRNNRERSMISLSCPSGLNVETLQASMQDTGMAAVEAQETTSLLTHGWSKTVASAALLGDFEVPRTRSTSDAVEKSSTDRSDGGSSATPHLFPDQQAPLASPAFRRVGTAAYRRAGPALPLNAAYAESAPSASPITPAAQGWAFAEAASKTLDAIPGAIKVASYNILASRLASTDLYPHCPPSVLSEDYRINRVKEELRQVDPDILLVEEISVSVHEELLGPYLKSALGLEGNHAVITDRNGQPRCSTRLPTATSATPSQKGPSSTRKKVDGFNLAVLRGTGGVANTPVTPASPSYAARAAGDPHAVAAGGEGKGNSSLPPLVGTGSSATRSQPQCGNGSLSGAPAIGGKSSRSPLRSRAPPSLSSLGATFTTSDTTNSTPPPSSHGDRLQGSNSALELKSIAAGVTAAAPSDGTRRSPRKRPVSDPLPSPSLPAAPDVSAANGGAESHRRVEMDGVAVYYKANRFRVLEVVPVYFNAIAAAEGRLTPYEHQKLQVNSHNVALLTVLLDTQAPGLQHVYIIAAVHFIWQRTNAQLWQAHQLMCALEELRSRYSRVEADLATAAAPRHSLRVDNLPTQPPSLAETPLCHEIGARNGVRRELPKPASPRRRHSVPSGIATGPPDTTAESIRTATAADGGNVHNATASLGTADRPPWRRESVVSASTTMGGVLVTCVIGGDFNSDRNGPVMEYLRTGCVPEGVQVMDYWKAATPLASPLCETANAMEEKRVDTVRNSIGEEERSAEEKQPAPLPLPPALRSIVAHTPPERPQTVCMPRLDVSTLPHPNSSSSSSFGSPPSPVQPSMQPRRQTQSPLGTFDDDTPLLAEAAADAVALQPSTPPRHRQSQPFPSRTRDLVSALVDSAASTPESEAAAVPNDAPVHVVSAAPAVSPRSTAESPHRVPSLSHFRFGRTSPSPITSPDSDSMAEVAEHSSVAPPVRATTASVSPARTRCRSHDSQSSLSHSSRRHKAYRSSSRTNNENPLIGSAGSTSLYSRRRASVEAPRSAGSSALMDFAPGNKSASCSHSVSEYESVLSNPFGTGGCSMRLPQHVHNDTPSAESSVTWWMSEEGQGPGQQQKPLPPTPVRRRSYTPGRLQRLTPTLLSPSPNSSVEISTLATPGKADPPAKQHTVSSPANGSSGDSWGIFGSLIHPQLSQMDNCEAPPAPRAGAKRRPANHNATHTVSGASTNGTCADGPPASPQAPRQHRIDAEGGAGTMRTTTTTSATNSVERYFSPVEKGPLSPSSSSDSVSSHEMPWPAALGEAAPFKPALGLIDDVDHALRLSDAYAPYCHRHPSRVSAVNPSTNAEGKVLDHILYEDEHVVCGAVLRLGVRQELPNARVPSDHYMIGAVLVPIQELHHS
ncbi:endonuclease/exonuclease/phosphatase-like protein [Leptomonas pyrrhocoris]|uniref:Endonuclease/exonuclease/phosphatase-like protein n=1 Tax=Leptomonas pyrrhocoris TaxID=157538 RepID=A0A0N0DZP5_LEPPY|nr:endonuclease/exonuclease/phosphatase-like protein [Leptomonas pyrrhocoris]XP_015663881.1 endonuclease/exonuclease/phosphatase-like protein [Leptomonas pyrrhocoris]KPA85441.1 endonuclease/exonuclease/phosphatase-like protein [Leptomonas pyrrhocoris]KPA85442.1 endonuclease/exonuclease/phosphatase-like protein [Leptomonas pyrrhocoris]|eukprot:XP_015663880.1 endonuclease/exonuclease/phosphatase-like protein [Leptomonas pyrrhocoris]